MQLNSETNKQTKNTPNNPIKKQTGTSLAAPWLRLCAPNAGGPGSSPGQGTRSHMHAATKSSHAISKTQRNQIKINKYF